MGISCGVDPSAAVSLHEHCLRLSGLSPEQTRTVIVRTDADPSIEIARFELTARIGFNSWGGYWSLFQAADEASRRGWTGCRVEFAPEGGAA